MTVSGRPQAAMVAVGLCWASMAVCIAAGFIFDAQLGKAGRSDLAQFPEDGVIFGLPILSCAAVGSALAIRRPQHPVGWILAGLAVVIAVSGAFDAYAAYGAVARPGALPGADFIATVSDASFVPWLMLLSGVILFTPSGVLATRPSRVAGWVVVIGGTASFLLILLSPYEGDYLSEGTVANPLALERIAGALNVATTTALIVLHAGLLAGVALLVGRFLTSRGPERRQLRWMALAAVPFPILVASAFAAATLDNDVLLGLSAAGFVAVVPIAVGLAVEQDHLYDVDRLLSRGLTYSLLTLLLVASYAITVVFVGQALGEFGGDSQLPSIAATLVAVSVALPARRSLQESLDRRFSRRQFEAIAAVRRFVSDPASITTVEQVLRDALEDERLTVAYWVEERQLWVDEAGETVTPSAAAVLAHRRGDTVAAIDSNTPARDRRLFAAVVAAAMPEIENARLRAAIGQQLVEVRESRTRIIAAQMEERRRIERNLHDGAQQRLLALALRLRAAEVSADPARLRAAIAAGVDEARAAVRELRELANGLHPSTLADGGLGPAFEELAARSPLPIELSTTKDRFRPEVEEAAWYIVCEAVTNAVKHAAPTTLRISCSREDNYLRLSVADDGSGGADEGGNGLRGIADRAEALGGRVYLRAGPTGGTLVSAELPCG